MAKPKNGPLMQNKHVKELLGIMESNQLSNRKDLLDVIGYVNTMERQLDNAANQLQAMRQELSDMREAQNHPVRTALQNAVQALEKNIAAMRERLDDLKQNIIDGCKNAVAAFKEKGITALHNIASFFKIRPGLEAMRDSLDNGIKADGQAIAKIETVSAEYHEAGKHLKNMGRAMVGKEAVQEANAPGKLAKAFEAPFRAERACLTAAKKSVNAAIGKLNQLEKTANEKPSILKTMQELNQQIAQAQKSAPAPDRPRPVANDTR